MSANLEGRGTEPLRRGIEESDFEMGPSWRLQLLRYNFTIVHRPERMRQEVDLLSRYNAVAEDLRRREGRAP